MLRDIVLVGVGSMLGGVSRFLLSLWIKSLLPTLFPMGTFAVNIAGCFLLGIVYGLFSAQENPNLNHYLFLAIGFCGSFTTFSTFSLENFQLLSEKAYLFLSLNIGLSVILGMIVAWFGYIIVK